jgi:hypothetical protein
MANFRIWGRTEQTGPSQFSVIASAVRDDQRERPMVLTEVAHSLHDANAAKERLMIQVGELVKARGDRVVLVGD